MCVHSVRDQVDDVQGAMICFCGLQERSGAEGSSSSPEGWMGLLGRSEPRRALFQQLRTLAPSRFPVVLQGEVGTGKRRIAEVLHRVSDRVSGPFGSLDLRGMSDEQQEHTLFGKDGGGGLLERCHGGTLYLMGLRYMGSAAQRRLSRFLKEGLLEPTDGAVPISLDVRLLVASEVDLQQPELRRPRRVDIPFLAEHHLPPPRPSGKREAGGARRGPGRPRKLTPEAVRETLERTRGNRSEAARLLQVSRATVSRYLDRDG